MKRILQAWSLLLSWLLLGSLGFCSDKELHRRITLKDCASPVDDPTGQFRARQWADIQAMGSRGRHALFEIAKLPKPKPQPSGLSSDSRPCALGYLARLKDSHAAPLARQVFADTSEDPAFRYEAVNILGDLDDRESVPVLVSFMKSDDFQLATGVVDALGKIDDDRARSALREVLDDSSIREKWPDSPQLSYIAYLRRVIWNIGRQHDTFAFEAIVRLSRTELSNDLGSRGSLCYALAKIGFWKGDFKPAMDLIAESSNPEQKRQILHGVIGGLWEDYWGNDARFSRSFQLEEMIRQFEGLYPRGQVEK